MMVVAVAFHPAILVVAVQRLRGIKSVDDRIAEYGPAARGRFAADFRREGVDYPPKRMILVGIKDEKVLQVYAAKGDGHYSFIKSYRILAASRRPGPKLREGDGQVPEGIYKVDSLNPNSLYHLSIRLNYPNEFDRAMAKSDGRTELGQDIMIHGSDGSIGCLAMGDPASEELFVLVHDTGIKNVTILLCPTDFRKGNVEHINISQPKWVSGLYKSIAKEMGNLPESTTRSE
jgi:hypothetical protein